MPALGPVKRRDLIAYLRQLGFDGPKPGGNHEYMVRGKQRIQLPNPHQSDIGIELLKRILAQGGISRQEWEQL